MVPLIDQNNEMQPCSKNHDPNNKTLKALRNTKKGKNLIKAKDIQDLFKKFGI